ncbi:MAG: FAD:protein FMN transferase [Gammaproteobacteria bacterium]
MGTTWRVMIASLPRGVQRAGLQADIEAILDRIDRGMSTWRADSELSRFNAHAGTDWYPVSMDVATVVTAALEVGRASGGAFDVTVEPLVELWGFGRTRQAQRVPDPDAVAAARARVGYRMLHARTAPSALRKDRPDLRVDLSAIAPGYAADLIAAMLDRLGTHGYLIDVGGELFARGRNGSGQRWRVGVQTPDAAPGRFQAVVELHDRAMSTSGDYRNFFEVDGVRYSHLIDPRRGRPVSSPLASVTVLAPDAMHANAWDTALMVLGPRAGPDLAQRLGIPAMFIARTPQGLVADANPALEEFLRR